MVKLHVQYTQERFNFVPNYRLDDVMLSYGPIHGSVGPHVDNYDVFLLQARGEKKWMIEDDPLSQEQERERLLTGVDMRILKDFNADVIIDFVIWDYLQPSFNAMRMGVDCVCCNQRIILYCTFRNSPT